MLQLLKVFGAGLVKSGMLKPLGTAARETGEVVESALPKILGGVSRETTHAPRPTQLSLIGDLQRTQPGRSVYGPKISPADVDYRAMLRPSPRAADVPSLPATPPRGQLSLFEPGPAPVPAFRTTPVQGPISRTAEELYASDPGTYRSISDLARRASAYYGKPVSIDDLVAPGGTKFLQNLENNLRGASAIVRAPGGAMRPPTTGAAVELAERGGTLATSPGGSLAQYIQRARGAADDVMDVDVRDVTNAMGGVRQGNLAKLGLAFGIPGGLAAAYMAGRTSAPEAAPEAPLQTPMGPTTESADAGGVVNDPQAAQNRQNNIAQQIAAGMTPGARASIPQPTYRGADGQTVIVQRGEDEGLVSAKQQYVKPPTALASEYARRRQFAENAANKAQIIGELTQRGVLDTPELVAWAGANPTLAYDLLRKATGVNTLPSQQVPQPTQRVITAPAGSNTSNNMIGNTAATAEATLGGTQGSSDLRGFTSPQLSEEIMRLDPALIYALQGRNLI